AESDPKAGAAAYTARVLCNQSRANDKRVNQVSGVQQAFISEMDYEHYRGVIAGLAPTITKPILETRIEGIPPWATERLEEKYVIDLEKSGPQRLYRLNQLLNNSENEH